MPEYGHIHGYVDLVEGNSGGIGMGLKIVGHHFVQGQIGDLMIGGNIFDEAAVMDRPVKGSMGSIFADWWQGK